MKTLLLAASLVFAQAPVIRSLKYEGFKGIASVEIASRFKDRGIRIAVEEMYDPAQVDSARTVLQELLTEKGQTGVGGEERGEAVAAEIGGGDISGGGEVATLTDLRTSVYRRYAFFGIF